LRSWLYLRAVLLVSDVLQPGHHLAVLLFGHGEVAHGALRGCAVPVLLAWLEKDDVAGPHRLEQVTLALHAAEPGQDQDRLAERMCVPSRPGARFERDGRARERAAAGKRRIYPNRPGEILGRSLGRWL